MKTKKELKRTNYQQKIGHGCLHFGSGRYGRNRGGSQTDNTTNFMVFKPREKKQLFEFQVFINEQPIPRVSETCFWVFF